MDLAYVSEPLEEVFLHQVETVVFELTPNEISALGAVIKFVISVWKVFSSDSFKYKEWLLQKR